MKHTNALNRIMSIIRYTYHAIKLYSHDAIKYYRNSLSSGLTNEDKYLGAITLKAHVVEKGITMPNRRYNFGEDNLKALIDLCNDYTSHYYDTTKAQFQAAINVIFEYELIHLENNKVLPHKLVEDIENLRARFPHQQIHQQPTVTKSTLFQRRDFKYIAENRHSIRNFCGTIPLQKIKDAIELAQTAPSACNRQPIHVHIVDKKSNPKLFYKILDLQKGNRGFGVSADKLLIITSVANVYIGLQERNMMYIDGGIFTMNLLYALQYYEIAACTLSTSLLPKTFSKDILGVSETPITIIAVGDCPESFLVARSQKKSLDSIIHIH